MVFQKFSSADTNEGFIVNVNYIHISPPTTKQS